MKNPELKMVSRKKIYKAEHNVNNIWQQLELTYA